MISLACVQARKSIDAGVAGLGDLERLRLEDHLANCVQCAADADAIASLRALVEEALPAGGEARRKRAVQRALASRAADAIEPAAPRRAPFSPAAAGLALAAAAALAVGVSAWRDAPAAPVVHAPTASDGPAAPTTRARADLARVVAGALRIDGHTVATGSAVGAGLEATSVGASRVQLGPAALALEDASVFRWEPAHATVRLRRGTLRAHVDKLRHDEFRVATDRFVVVVTGTRFSVTPERVDVEEGSVRIESSDGTVLLDTVTAGEHWSEPVESEARDATAPPRRMGDARWLATARQRLSTGDVAGARDAIARARPVQLPRAARAEAETLRAECAQVDGKLGEAIERYLAVARRYDGLRAGDNALFAAAKVAATRGDRALERRLLRRYLAAHPRGRFRAEAERRLGLDRAEEQR